MTKQLHKRLIEEQVKTILDSYVAKEITSTVAREKLTVGKTRFFALLKAYRKDPDTMALRKKRLTPTRGIGKKAEKFILKELRAENKLIINKGIPITTYNYSAIRDTLLQDHGIRISVPTIIHRAKEHGYYIEKKPRKKTHDREVLTNFVGELVQHDSSHHLFSPYMDDKLYLITSLDDYSRLILFAELFLRETSWAHINTAETVALKYGCALKYYVDQHSIFRFVRGRDQHSTWKAFQGLTDSIVPQFKQVLSECGISLSYALSPQAKGKIERPYRWLQDRLVRTAAHNRICRLEDLRSVLQNLVNMYNTKWIHSTTKEIPIIRFEKALREGKSLFKPFKIQPPYQVIEDIFCLRTKRIVDAYRKISIDGMELRVPNGVPRETLDLRIIPDITNGLTTIRFWQQDKYLGQQKVKSKNLKIVHF